MKNVNQELNAVIAATMTAIQSAIEAGNADLMAMEAHLLAHQTKGLMNLEEVKREPKLEVPVNRCYGGFCLSERAAQAMGIDSRDWNSNDIAGQWARTSPIENEKLRAFIREHGIEAVGDEYARIEMVTVDNSLNWWIEEEDGFETIVFGEKKDAWVWTEEERRWVR